ncbi:MAG: hypothetical protein LXA50_23925, partial [Betaproteobacteria bacterium]|nr:hypothetical protein [Betaproteobacteria bacterium]
MCARSADTLQAASLGKITPLTDLAVREPHAARALAARCPMPDPDALSVSRSCASGERLTYRHSRSRFARWPGLIDTPACSENPPACAAALRPSPSSCAATVYSVNTFCPAHGPTAIRHVMQ